MASARDSFGLREYWIGDNSGIDMYLPLLLSAVIGVWVIHKWDGVVARVVLGIIGTLAVFWMAGLVRGYAYEEKKDICVLSSDLMKANTGVFYIWTDIYMAGFVHGVREFSGSEVKSWNAIYEVVRGYDERVLSPILGYCDDIRLLP